MNIVQQFVHTGCSVRVNDCQIVKWLCEAYPLRYLARLSAFVVCCLDQWNLLMNCTYVHLKLKLIYYFDVQNKGCFFSCLTGKCLSEVLVTCYYTFYRLMSLRSVVCFPTSIVKSTRRARTSQRWHCVGGSFGPELMGRS
jgi:hypothetical protein